MIVPILQLTIWDVFDCTKRSTWIRLLFEAFFDVTSFTMIMTYIFANSCVARTKTHEHIGIFAHRMTEIHEL